MGYGGVLNFDIIKNLPGKCRACEKIYKIKGGEDRFSVTEPIIILTKKYEQTMNE